MDSSLERMEDLLVKRSLEGLSNEEVVTLRRLCDRFPQIDVAAFDRAVAAISFAGLPSVEEMPAGLYANIEAIGMQIAAEHRASSTESKHSRSAQVIEMRAPPEPTKPAGERAGLVAWFVAAASVVIAVVASWPAPEQPALADFAERRRALIASGARLEPWSATDDVTASGASGDIVWSSERQEGYMRIAMLSVNDPRTFQYQLWIFDADRDSRYPVDGGVFDVAAGAAEVIVPIHAGLPVRNATLFAITVEQPGGVVVSDRERIALLADFG